MSTRAENLQEESGQYNSPQEGLGFFDSWALRNAYAEADAAQQQAQQSPPLQRVELTSEQKEADRQIQRDWAGYGDYMARQEAERNRLPRRSIQQKLEDDWSTIQRFFGRQGPPEPQSTLSATPSHEHIVDDWEDEGWEEPLSDVAYPFDIDFDDVSEQGDEFLDDFLEEPNILATNTSNKSPWHDWEKQPKKKSPTPQTAPPKNHNSGPDIPPQKPDIARIDNTRTTTAREVVTFLSQRLGDPFADTEKNYSETDNEISMAALNLAIIRINNFRIINRKNPVGITTVLNHLRTSPVRPEYVEIMREYAFKLCQKISLGEDKKYENIRKIRDFQNQVQDLINTLPEGQRIPQTQIVAFHMLAELLQSRMGIDIVKRWKGKTEYTNGHILQDKSLIIAPTHVW